MGVFKRTCRSSSSTESRRSAQAKSSQQGDTRCGGRAAEKESSAEPACVSRPKSARHLPESLRSGFLWSPERAGQFLTTLTNCFEHTWKVRG